MNNIKIIKEKCSGCGICVIHCQFKAISISNKKAVIGGNCNLCGMCVSTCKFDAICIDKSIPAKSHSSEDYKGVWVFGEIKNNMPVKVVLELLGEGRRLADMLHVPLSAVILGHDIQNCARILMAYGADRVYAVDAPSLRYYNDEAYCDILVQLIDKYKPEIVLIGATTYGRSLAPRVSSRLNTGLTADCIKLEIDNEKRLLLQTRPAFGGNIMATIICPCHRPQMATVRPNVMKVPEPCDKKRGDIIKPEVAIPKSPKVSIKDIIVTLSENVNLSEAEIIVAAGRGISSPKNLYIIKDLARVLGAAVGATRAIVDSGWIDYSHQVGQTGKTVRPKIYFACGISGALQHLAGMTSSDTIIAINKNPEAPIFKVAKFGMVGDLMEIIPALIKELEARIK